jgi:hypothetical protein
MEWSALPELGCTGKQVFEKIAMKESREHSAGENVYV